MMVQLRGVTRGLIYMHSQEVVHGNLKGVCFRIPRLPSCVPLTCPKANILIDNEDNPRLTDFSVVTTASEESTIVSPLSADGNLRWTSPELLYPEKFGLKDNCPTVQSDAYALGMVIYEVLSGQVPFVMYQDHEIVFMILDGDRPERPQADVGGLFTDVIWGVLGSCWKEQPGDRPSVKQILMGLDGESSSSWLSSSIDELVELDPADDDD